MFDKNKEIMVLNYNAFPIVVSTKYQEYTIPAAERGHASSLPLTWDEVLTINSNTRVFKNGFLTFDSEDAPEIYKALRIMNWESILTNEQIEEIILHPTKEGVAQIVAIDDDVLFDRVRGIYTFLRNNGYDISNRIDTIMTMRYKELKDGKKTSSIVISDKSVDDSDKIKALEKEIAELKAALLNKGDKEEKEEPKPEKAATAASKTPAKSTSTKTKKASSTTKKT